MCASIMNFQLSMPAARAFRRPARGETHSKVCSRKTLRSHCFLINGPGKNPVLGHGSTANSHPRCAEGAVVMLTLRFQSTVPVVRGSLC